MNILTFDLEEWFHILDHDSTRTVESWKRYESRIHANAERILFLLDAVGARATFFCVGWIAETYPEVIRDIAERGHEIASHTSTHQLVYEQAPDEFLRDTERSIKTLEDITGKKVRCFRAPGFSIREDAKWAFEILASLGIEIDSSIFPAPRAHGGFPSYREPRPSLLRYNGIALKEFPINYAVVMGKAIIYSGGGYFRFAPYRLIKHWISRSSYVMTYFHPRDFDPEQPRISTLPLSRVFKSYVGLKGAFYKFQKLLDDFTFVDIAEANGIINWNSVPVVNI
jgi:polysaccharide deacetylase family protein (PEP-CTERM system associated)